MATTTLDRMAEGGIRDHLGGGFHRYSTDEKWLIPHFEKMLYDTALLVPAYLEAHVATRAGHYAQVVREACDWVLREMVTPAGGFASSQDADSEGEEGRFFVWTPEELANVLGAKRGAWAAAWFGVTDEGNFEHGRSALWTHEPAARVAERLRCDVGELATAMEEARRLLWEAREKRVHPGTDDKVLASWNGLMISALAQAFQVLGDARCLDAARRAARFVLSAMRQPDGRLFATARSVDGRVRAHLYAYFDDYACLIQALIDVYESDFDEAWLREALALEAIVTAEFEDGDKGGWFTTGKNHESLIARLKNPHDGALPSGNGVQTLNLLRLAEITGQGVLAQRAERAMLSLGAMVNLYPAAFSQLLLAVDFLAAGPRSRRCAGPSFRSASSFWRDRGRTRVSCPWSMGRLPAPVVLAPTSAGTTRAELQSTRARRWARPSARARLQRRQPGSDGLRSRRGTGPPRARPARSERRWSPFLAVPNPTVPRRPT